MLSNGMQKIILQHRCQAVHVMLKEKKPLLLAVRETPFNRIHLENMLKVHDAGGVVCPPMPSFYHHPENLEEMAGFVAGRLADLMGFEIEGLKRWKGL
jgi:4-hydroxy-3-polyprenylbenzoate decarboxylase